MNVEKISLVIIMLLSITFTGLKAQVGINTEDPQAMLDVNGSVRMGALPGVAPELGSVLESSNDKGDLRWVKNIAVPYMLFVQSTYERQISFTVFNADTTTLHTVFFNQEDKTNAINTIDASFIGSDTIRIGNAGSYEIAGYVNYFHDFNYFDNTSTKCRFNLIVRKSADGGKSWEDIAGARFSVFPVVVYDPTASGGAHRSVALQTITGALPAHIVHLEEGCLLRYGFVKVSSAVTERLIKGIFIVGAQADGMKYTSSLKITKL
ncbi:MAG: hypothetical protein LBJ60_07755 [Tannerellaceae bacterium]|jgi:hypothetical protein|nr:hypothetical protein [Tannerellaceae bacterium]